jgi:exodeoxyribonuclease V alpha subunit
MEDIQVITPMKKTAVGVLTLNLRLQERLNPPSPEKREISFRSFTFRVGDRVMQIKNNYEKEVFNGDLGRIVEIDDDEKVLVSFPDAQGERIVAYAGDELEELALSYALSVHKSQGSEFPVVVMPLVIQHFVMLQRNLLYTAITRAKKLMVLVGSKQALAAAVRNSRALMRYSCLSERICDEFEKSQIFDMEG